MRLIVCSRLRNIPYSGKTRARRAPVRERGEKHREQWRSVAPRVNATAYTQGKASRLRQAARARHIFTSGAHLNRLPRAHLYKQEPNRAHPGARKPLPAADMTLTTERFTLSRSSARGLSSSPVSGIYVRPARKSPWFLLSAVPAKRTATRPEKVPLDESRATAEQRSGGSRRLLDVQKRLTAFPG